jgi:drug/metabolite transporter (DMT)-like permease
MTGREMLASFLILGGVAVALFPGGRNAARPPTGFAAGIGFALVAAAGQGFGAVLSRRAFGIAREAGEAIDGISAAYQRILAGVVLGTLTFVIARYLGVPAARREPSRAPDAPNPGGDSGADGGLRRAAPWIVVNAFAGPALGVSCFQWALAERGTGVVLPIVALTPLVIIPFSMWFEGERPSGRSLLGGVIAVAGAIIHASEL